jgi:hypothetical protein
MANEAIDMIKKLLPHTPYSTEPSIPLYSFDNASATVSHPVFDYLR